MQFHDFTDMKVWQDANDVVQKVYALCLKLPKSEDYALSSQLKRAALSIAANIAEGFGRSHQRDKVNFYLYARGSAFEVRNHIIIGRNLNFFSEDDISPINELCKLIVQSINKIIKGFKSQP